MYSSCYDYHERAGDPGGEESRKRRARNTHAESEDEYGIQNDVQYVSKSKTVHLEFSVSPASQACSYGSGYEERDRIKAEHPELVLHRIFKARFGSAGIKSDRFSEALHKNAEYYGEYESHYRSHRGNISGLLLVFGARFSDRVAAVPKKFAPGAYIAHFDVDPSEFNKVKSVQASVCGDLLDTMSAFLERLEKGYKGVDLSDWQSRLQEYAKEHPVRYKRSKIEDDEDMPIAQESIEILSNATQDQDVVITTGVGQHQLWTTLFYHFNKPRTWLSSCGLGTMGFGLPSAMGAKIARPEANVIAIEGDGSLQMNIQELATCVTEHIPVKLLLINNQHLGNVVQWEDMFFKHNHANTYLGDIDDKENFSKGDGYHLKRYPDYVQIAKAYGWQAVAVEKRSEFSAALQRMLESKGPFMIDLRVPYCEYVLPMIPPGGTIDSATYA